MQFEDAANPRLDVIGAPLARALPGRIGFELRLVIHGGCAFSSASVVRRRRVSAAILRAALAGGRLAGTAGIAPAAATRDRKTGHMKLTSWRAARPSRARARPSLEFGAMTPDEYCQQKAAASGSSFYYAFLFLPPERRRAITAVYAYCREVDDIVDEVIDPRWRRQNSLGGAARSKRFSAANPNHPVTRALQPFVVGDLRHYARRG